MAWRGSSTPRPVSRRLSTSCRSRVCSFEEERRLRRRLRRPDPPAATTPAVSCNSPHAARLAATGSATGLLSGLFGGGGGLLIVPALVLIASLPMRRAVATSLWVIAIISAIGLLSHVMAGHRLDIGITVGFVLGGLAGMALGIAVGKRIAGPTLQKLFAGMIVAVAVFMLAKLVVH